MYFAVVDIQLDGGNKAEKILTTKRPSSHRRVLPITDSESDSDQVQNEVQNR